MSGFDDACLVNDSDAVSVTSFVSSAHDSGADTDTDVSVVSTMRNEQYLVSEIKATKENIESLKTKPFYSNEVELDNILDLTKPRPNIDQEIMSEILEIEGIIRNEKLPTYLKASAKTAKEKTVWAAECAQKEGTTVKRPIEILRSTLDVFSTACIKACEEHKLKSEAHIEFLRYKEYQEKIKKCVSDVSERNAYVARGEEHLATSIELAKNNIEDIVGMAAREIKEERLNNFKETKRDIQNMTQSEMHDVKEWLKNCRSDLNIIEELLNNQDERFPYVEKMHADDTENLTVKLQVNRDEQEDLKRQLQEKQNEEKKLRATLYHHKCQYEKFEKLHEDFKEAGLGLREKIRTIESSAKTTAVVMKHIEESSCELFDASIRAEEEFLQMLKKLEIEAKESYLQALITSGVDTRVHIDYAVENYEYCKKEVRDLKSKLQNAVKKGMQVLANDTKENLKKYEQELVAAKIEKEKLQQNLQKLTKDIENVSEDLKSMGVKGQDTLELLYERRKLEENEPDEEEGMFSLG